MRITFIMAEAGMGGGTRVVAAYARALRDRGHQVTVVSRPARPRPWRERLFAAGRPRQWQALRRRRDGSHLDDLAAIHRRLERWRCVEDADVPDSDVVIATWWETAEWVSRLSDRKGSKIYLIQGHEVFPYLPVDRVRATYHLPLRKVVVSQWLSDVMRDQYGDPDAIVVPNAVDPRQFNAPPRIRQPAFTVGMVVSDSPCKNSIMGFNAVAAARAHLPELRLICFGSQPDWSRIPGRSWTTCHVRPAQAVIRDCYAQCDAWLFTSIEEGFGLPILEAMACRTPVIATPAGAAPQLLSGGGGAAGGVLLKDFTAETMANAIVDVARMSDAAWRQMSDRAHATATSYTWDHATDLFEAALERIAHANRENPGENGVYDRPGALSSAVDVEEVRGRVG